MATTIRKKIGQCMIVGIQGHTLTADEKKFISENNIGGIALFGRNVSSPEQIHALTAEIQSLRAQMSDKTPFFIGIDMEGGRVARLKAPFTQWPPLKLIGDLDSATVAFKMAESMGRELKAVGINLDFAPCIDLFTNPKNTVIGDRAISGDPEQVAKLGSALVRGYIKAEILPCAKHFPGHGNTMLDSHEQLPVEESTLEELLAREFIPFRKVLRARLEFMMSAHIKFPKIDPEYPATLSRIFLEDLLRGELGYRNIIITDDLDMKALRNTYSIDEIPVLALNAGANVLLYCNEPESPIRALDAVEKALVDKKMKMIAVESSYSRVMELKKEKLTAVEPMPLMVMTSLIGHPQHVSLARAIAEGKVPDDIEV